MKRNPPSKGQSIAGQSVSFPREKRSGRPKVAPSEWWCPACGKVMSMFEDATRHHQRGCEA